MTETQTGDPYREAVEVGQLQRQINAPTPNALLILADELCKAACEIVNQREPAEPWPHPDGPIPMSRSPDWSFEDLSRALNAYYDARRCAAAHN